MPPSFTVKQLMGWGWTDVTTPGSAYYVYKKHDNFLYVQKDGSASYIPAGGERQAVTVTGPLTVAGSADGGSSTNDVRVGTGVGNETTTHSGSNGSSNNQPSAATPGTGGSPAQVSSPFGQLTLQGDDAKGNKVYSNDKGEGEVITPTGRSTFYTDMTDTKGVISGTVYLPTAGSSGVGNETTTHDSNDVRKGTGVGNETETHSTSSGTPATDNTRVGTGVGNETTTHSGSGESGASKTTPYSDETPTHTSSPFGQLTLQGEDAKGDVVYADNKGQGEVITPGGKTTLYTDMTDTNGVVAGTVYKPSGTSNAGDVNRTAGFGSDNADTGKNAGSTNRAAGFGSDSSDAGKTEPAAKTTEPKSAGGFTSNSGETANHPNSTMGAGVGNESTTHSGATGGGNAPAGSFTADAGVGNEASVHSGHGDDGGSTAAVKPTVLPAYAGGADIASVKGLNNGDLLTTTVTGAEVETTPTGSYTVKAAPPTPEQVFKTDQAKSNDQASMPSAPVVTTAPAPTPVPTPVNSTPAPSTTGIESHGAVTEVSNTAESAMANATHLADVSNAKSNDAMAPPIVNPPITLPPSTPNDTPSPGLGSLNPSNVADTSSNAPKHFGFQAN